MKNVLITGAGGFLGSHLIEALQNTQFTVYALTSKKENLINKYKNCKVFSIEDWENNQFPMDEIDVVVHCAFAKNSTPTDLGNSLNFSKRIFSSFKCNILNISSRSVYGQNPEGPWKEDTIVQPNNLYGFAKYTDELQLNLYNQKNEHSCFSNLRLAGLVGLDLNDRIINRLIDSIIETKSIKIIGGKQEFAFLDVGDAAQAIVSLLNMPSENWKEVYNVGPKETYGILEIAETAIEIANKFKFKNIRFIHEQTDNTLFAHLNSSLFCKDTNWNAVKSLRMITEEIFNHKIKNISSHEK